MLRRRRLAWPQRLLLRGSLLCRAVPQQHQGGEGTGQGAGREARVQGAVKEGATGAWHLFLGLGAEGRAIGRGGGDRGVVAGSRGVPGSSDAREQVSSTGEGAWEVGGPGLLSPAPHPLSNPSWPSADQSGDPRDSRGWAGAGKSSGPTCSVAEETGPERWAAAGQSCCVSGQRA